MRTIIVLFAVGLLLLPVHLSAQCSGCQDFATLNGAAGSYYGFSVAVIGDINEDGIADFIVGAHNGPDIIGNFVDLGKAWIYSGADPTGAPLKEFSGWYNWQEQNGMFGYCVSGAGDVNDDGYPDVIIGAPNLRQAGTEWRPTGRAHVYSGNLGAGCPSLGFPILMPNDIYRVGWCVASAGDVNNDGRDDVIVSAPKDSTGSLGGHVFVYALVNNGGNDVWTELYEKSGSLSYHQFGKTVSGAGDVNNDGHDDFMIYSKYFQGKGAAYVYSGIDGQLLHTLVGTIINGYFGTRMAPLGDIDNDECDDFIIANNIGSVYLYSGQTGTLLHTFTSGNPTNSTFGDDIASAGDYDNDGTMDILIGFSAYNNMVVYSGATYQHLSNNVGTGDHCGAAVAGPLATLSDGYNITLGGSPNSNSVSVFACGYPVVDFEGDPVTGVNPLTVNFTDLSSPDITAWSWDFGDGGTSTDENPVHEFADAGTYTVSLAATGLNCSDTETKTDYITVNYGPPVADFTAEPLSGTVPLEVSFTNQSTNYIPESSYWIFGDGEYTYGENNTTHTYTLPGTYDVTLSVNGLGGGDDLETKQDYITVVLPPGPTLLHPPDSIAMGAGTTFVAWYCDPNRMYEVWIDDDPGFGSLDRTEQDLTSGTTIGSWVVTPELPVGVWYWKVRGYESGEAWTEWSDTWHFTLVDPPEAPTLVQPDNGRTWTTTGTHVTLAWNELPYIINYRVLFDNNLDFSSPLADTAVVDTTWLTARYTSGTFYWKVQALNAAGWGPWSEVRWFRLIRYIEPSCPVLLAWDGNGYVEKNTLLTACEESGYKDVVTDYYHITGEVKDRDGRVSFQIREMEDEITYLHDVELISVTHSEDTRIACSAGGEISAYKETRMPISAVDQDGNDCLDLLASVDGERFTSDGPGHLIVKFSDIGSGKSVFRLESLQKPKPCEEELDDLDDRDMLTSGGDGVLEGEDLVIEILADDGSWVEMPTLPGRDQTSDEFIFADTEATAGKDLVTLRLSWEKGYSTDVLGQIIPADEDPVCKVHRIDRSDLLRLGDSGEIWTGFNGNTPLVLRKGDALEFSFAVELPDESGLIQDYIICAKGRYEPDASPRPEVESGRFQLHGNYPNPFNPTTTISYDLPSATRVNITIFDVAGRMITTVIDEIQAPGNHQAVWDGKDRNGHVVASGVYFYRFVTDGYIETKKMMLLR